MQGEVLWSTCREKIKGMSEYVQNEAKRIATSSESRECAVDLVGGIRIFFFFSCLNDAID